MRREDALFPPLLPGLPPVLLQPLAQAPLERRIRARLRELQRLLDQARGALELAQARPRRRADLEDVGALAARPLARLACEAQRFPAFLVARVRLRAQHARDGGTGVD